MKLWRALEDGLSHYGILDYGRATGGSTTTLEDDNRSEDDEPEDFENATLIVLRDSAGASAAPEGEFSRVTEYDASTTTFTLADTLTAAIASGDRYGVTGNQFHHDELIELLYKGLVQLGDISFEDTSLTTGNDQTEYILPAGLKQYKHLDIYYQGKTGDSNDNKWIKIHDWDVSYTAGGSTALLYLPQLTSARTIRIVYWGQHPVVNDFDDDISEYLHPVLVRASFVERLANRAVQGTQHSVPSQRIGYDKASQEFQEAIRRYPINKHRARARLLLING